MTNDRLAVVSNRIWNLANEIRSGGIQARGVNWDQAPLMANWNSMNTLPSNFHGPVRLFPLPNFVMFPSIVRGLHIFEPRYRAMFEETIASDFLIAMALLKPGWESNYQGRPSVFDVVCIGKVIQHQRLADGRFNLLLQGMNRARIEEELVDDPAPFRRASVQLLNEEPTNCESNRAPSNGKSSFELTPSYELHLKRTLARTLLHKSPQLAVEPAFQQEAVRHTPLPNFTDIIASAARFPIEQKQLLLETTLVENRTRLLFELLGSKLPEPPAAIDKDDKDDGGDEAFFSLN